MDELRQHRPGSHRLPRDLLAADVDAAMVRRDREHDLAEEVPVVAVDGADQAAAAALHEIGGESRGCAR